MAQEVAKQAAAERALEFVSPGMVVGLGTGTTAAYFIEGLARKMKEGLQIQAVASSLASERIARSHNIPILSLDAVSHIDLTVDGADEIDREKQMIKGGGGALLREKILIFASKSVLILVDETKLSKPLGQKKLPIEVLPYGYNLTAQHIEALLLSGSFRRKEDHTLVTTDNGNFLFDVTFSQPPKDPRNLESRLLRIPGIVDTGFFFDLVDHVIIGSSDHTVTVI